MPALLREVSMALVTKPPGVYRIRIFAVMIAGSFS